ncbi:MAG TPA: hypothetical protein DDW27_03170 [Bacteroidales bacterium]|nr:hypothetical protein [Bacteroidales bacterium]
MDIFTELRWSPYIVGTGIGVLSWFSFLILRIPLSCSTSFSRTSGMIERIFRGKKVETKPYYQKVKLVIDWQWMMMIGIVAGSFISSLLSGDFNPEWVPAFWNSTFGHTPFLRVIVAMAGGILLGFGARWADGCTSGHGISGTMQLAVSGWISALSFFAGGIIVAFLIYRLSG